MIVNLLTPGCTSVTAPDQDWMQFRSNFILSDGRLIDDGQAGISHSEGQGIALLLAVHYDDPETFSSVWQWTQSHLQTRPDKLLAWSWSPQGGVRDRNNATDGDLLISWALARAGKRWENPQYLNEARLISRDIRELLVRPSERGPVLLPGMQGFERPEGLIVNLSYWVFPALRELDELEPAPEWQALRGAGIDLLREGRFGRWGLPADWILLAQTLAPAAGFPSRFSYDAVRIPLYLMWAGLDTPQLLQAFSRYWGSFTDTGSLPAWTDLHDDSIDEQGAYAGTRAIAQLALAAPDLSTVSLPELDTSNGYYSSALLLLCKVMLAERSR